MVNIDLVKKENEMAEIRQKWGERNYWWCPMGKGGEQSPP
jgi:hypothetical protein